MVSKTSSTRTTPADPAEWTEEDAQAARDLLASRQEEEARALDALAALEDRLDSGDADVTADDLLHAGKAVERAERLRVAVESSLDGYGRILARREWLERFHGGMPWRLAEAYNVLNGAQDKLKSQVQIQPQTVRAAEQRRDAALAHALDTFRARESRIVSDHLSGHATKDDATKAKAAAKAEHETEVATVKATFVAEVKRAQDAVDNAKAKVVEAQAVVDGLLP